LVADIATGFLIDTQCGQTDFLVQRFKHLKRFAVSTNQACTERPQGFIKFGEAPAEVVQVMAAEFWVVELLRVVEVECSDRASGCRLKQWLVIVNVQVFFD